MTGEPMSELRRRVATARPAPLRGPAQAFAGDEFARDWNQELPSTAVEVVLELDGVWDLELDHRHTECRAFAAGMLAAPARSRAQGSVRLIQLAVDPLAVPALLGVPAGKLAGIAAPIDALLGADAERLLDQLNAATSPAFTAEAWASGCIAAGHLNGPSVPADVRRAAELIRVSGGTIRVDAIASELGCSRRHLSRRFREWIGVSPSAYRRLARFESATTALRRVPGQQLGRLALDCGYADHAHMDRDFAALAAATPSEVAARFSSARHD
ncbi:MAG: AraC family transcriptional regulator [Solirubrobacteraceae bacterium]|nr:AraC family transcriptional regulator [Solirubrobacteraceae bacterium]